MFFSKKKKEDTIAPDEVLLDAQNMPNFNTHQFEGRMEQPIPIRSLLYLGVFFALFFALALYRTIDLQIVHGDAYTEKSEQNRLRKEPIFANRGIIYDRQGEIIASNVLATTTDAALHEPPRRVYANLDGLFHVLGFVSYPKKDQSGVYWQSEYIGKDGLERHYNEILKGSVGTRVVEVDAIGNPLSMSVIKAPKDGENLTLSIDAKVSDAVYGLLARANKESGFTGGAAVIMDIHTGQVLTLVSFPEFDANSIGTKEGTEALTNALKNTKKPFLNRAISGLYAPGSTVKPFIATAALTEGTISPNKQIESKGFISIPNPYGGEPTIFRDWKAHGYTDMREAIAVSSDVYFYAVGGGYKDQVGLGIARIEKYMRLFGFDSYTGIDLPNESKGSIPSPEWKQKIFGEDWLLGNTYHTSIGQYGFQVTALELARAISAIANGGTLVTPHVVLEGAQREYRTEKLPFKDEHLQIVREGMRQTVVSGSSQMLQQAGFPVAAKSGTAEIGLTKGRINSWMTGFFPYKDPKYAFVVVLENGPVLAPLGAGKTAADILKWIKENAPEYAGLPPLPKKEEENASTTHIEVTRVQDFDGTLRAEE